MSSIDAILETPLKFLGEEPTWGEDKLCPGEMWALCRVDGGQGRAALRYSEGEVRHLILSQKAHEVLLRDLKTAKKHIAGLGKETLSVRR